MTKAQQLPFDLGHREAFAREDLWVSAANADAVAWLDKYPAWGAPALVIYGPPASGKTHLCHVWQKKSGAVAVEKTDIARLAAANDFPKATMLDDAESLAGDAALETALFHFYNRAKEEGAHVLLTGTHAPKEWKLTVPDLKSRLLAAPAAAVGAPDEQLMAVVLAKLFSDRQLFVSQDVIAFILPRLERSFAALRAIASDIDRKALAEKRAVTIPLVREILQEQGKLF